MTNDIALIIDDDKDLTFMLAEIVKSKGFTVHIANTLQEARAAIKEVYPVIIILDNSLPDGFGLDFLHYLNENCPCSKVVFMTGDYELVPQEDQLKNIAKFLVKPFSIDEFRTQLAMLNDAW